MLRFIPDTWVEGLLRPFLLADSAAGLYIEIHAPDLRFAAAALLLAAALLGRRQLSMLEPAQWRLLLALVTCFYFWTLVSGNGRYFFWGLLVVGPLVVLSARHLRVTRAMRNTLLLGVFTLQGLAVSMTFEPNVWGLRPWVQGPGLALEPTPVAEKPAVILTIGAISYSIVVPALHPQSRWVNISGQQNLVPGMPEHARLQAMLDGPLPVKLMVRATHLVLGPEGQPLPQAEKVMQRHLQYQGLELSREPCELVRTQLAALPMELRDRPAELQGFLFCPVRRSGGVQEAPVTEVVAPEMDEVFAQVERRCPRFFPPGNALTRERDGALVRHYSHSDTSLYVDDSGEVYYKYFRALNPTTIATIEQVRQGRFSIDCTTLPGRYVPPWARD